MIECSLRKRQAQHAGEIGLFANDEMAAEDLAHVTNGNDVLCKISSPKSLQALRFLWALAQKVAENTDLGDKNAAMDELRLAIRFAKIRIDERSGRAFIVPNSLAQASNETLRRVTNRIVHHVCEVVLPGMDENALRAEIEQMTGATIRPERKRKGRAA